MIRSLLTLAFLAFPVAADAAVLGEAQACESKGTPAILARVTGLKDRTGDVRLELYPPNAQDFLAGDTDLQRQNKVFRRVIAPTPQGAGPVEICMRVPQPGTYALLLTHNRDGKRKFSIWVDGAGVPGNQRIGRGKPSLASALITVGGGTAEATIRTQYMHGFSGFGPVSGGD